MPRGPDGKEKQAMGSIQSLYKNVLLGLIPKNGIDLSWDYPYELFISSGPDGKEKLAMGLIPGIYKYVLLGLIPNMK